MGTQNARRKTIERILRMNYTVNQQERQGDEGLTIAAVVVNETGEKDATGIAIALNQAVVPRSQWENREVTDGDEIDILLAVQGG